MIEETVVGDSHTHQENIDAVRGLELGASKFGQGLVEPGTAEKLLQTIYTPPSSVPQLDTLKLDHPFQPEPANQATTCSTDASIAISPRNQEASASSTVAMSKVDAEPGSAAGTYRSVHADSDVDDVSGGGAKTESAPAQEEPPEPGGHRKRSRMDLLLLWKRAVHVVRTKLVVAQQFKTLRDMRSYDEIRKEQLKMVKVLGAGAFAVVEHCIFTPDTQDGSEASTPIHVAVKRLKPHVMKSDIDIRAMMKEVSLLKKLRNKYIVEFIGYGAYDPRSTEHAMQSLFLVEELVTGGNLKQLVHQITRQGAPPKRLYKMRDAMRWLTNVAHGLDYLHSSQPVVIHRDLKLENILLTSHDLGTATAKIADFGLSALVAAGGSAVLQRAPTMPGTGSMTPRTPSALPSKSSIQLEEEWNRRAVDRMTPLAASFHQNNHLDIADPDIQLSGRTGTLMYMAPEVYRQEQYNEKADVFSFAIIMYELLHRYMMISATDGSMAECQAYARRVARAGYRPPILGSLPAPLRHLIQACWHPSPSQRPAMGDVANRLIDIRAHYDIDKALEGTSMCGCTIC